MKNSLLLLVLVAFCACKSKKASQTREKVSRIVEIVADAETDAVLSKEDAADDPAIWVHATDFSKSIIIGTDKKYGLNTYTIDGEIKKEYPVGRVNNVDVRTRILLNGEIISIAAASNRTTNAIAVFKIDEETGELFSIVGKEMKSKLQEVYGFCLYYNNVKEQLYAFVVGKEGSVEQWELVLVGNKVEGKIVRSFNVGSQAEGMVADDFSGDIYIAEENVGLWKYKADLNVNSKRVKIASTSDLNMAADFEGVTLYDKGNGKGYVLVSSQGNNSYAVFDRETNLYQKSFSLVDGTKVDGTNDTDGIDVSSVSFGNKYPKGFFIAQDGSNFDVNGEATQNFKIVDWRKIQAILN